MPRFWFLLLGLILGWAMAVEADTIRLKNGRVIKGEVVRFSNGEFIIQVERTDAHPEHQDRMIVLVDTVESIEFEAGSAPGVAAEKLVVLDSRQEVVATGLHLGRSDKVRIRASGEMQFPDGRVTTPGGISSRDSLLPFPGERLGVLVAMVGNPQSPTYHVIGEDAEFETRSEGELFLQINARSLEGARGAYTARIRTPESTPAAGAAASTPREAPRPLGLELNVPADKEWTDTGLDLVEGDTLRITAAGTIRYTSKKTCGPEGGEREWKDLLLALPVNDAGRGALIGKMGESGTVRAFFVGERAEFTAERNGRLFLGINDDDYSNNRGSFKVKVEIVPRP